MKFLSKYAGHNIVIKPGQYSRDNLGNRAFTAGVRAEFINYQLDTQDEEVIEGLKRHKDYGRLFWSAEPGDEKTLTDQAKQDIADEEVRKSELVASCPNCPFKAVNEFGLKAHIRAKHQ